MFCRSTEDSGASVVEKGGAQILTRKKGREEKRKEIERVNE